MCCHHFYYYYQEQIATEMKKYCEKNIAASIRKCTETLNNLEIRMKNKMKQNQYAKRGGYTEYQRDLHEIQRKYNQTKGLGAQVCVLRMS